jgi:anti-sigma factor RsiW
MNQCRYGKTASRYFDKELGAGETQEFEAHLAECAACRARLRDYAALAALMGAKPAAMAAPDFMERVRTRASAGPALASVWRDAARLSRAMIPVAACLCLALGALLYVQIAQLKNVPAPVVSAQAAATQAEAVAEIETPLLGYALSETEQQYLFGDRTAALDSIYAVTAAQDSENGM